MRNVKVDDKGKHKKYITKCSHYCMSFASYTFSSRWMPASDRHINNTHNENGKRNLDAKTKKNTHKKQRKTISIESNTKRRKRDKVGLWNFFHDHLNNETEIRHIKRGKKETERENER